MSFKNFEDTYLLKPEPSEKDVVHPFLTICEGKGDATFILRLLQFMQITTCAVGCPSQQTGGQGVDRIPSYLQAIRAISKGNPVLKGIAVVADANGSARKHFKAIADGYEKAEFPRPGSPFRIYNKSLRIGVYFLPKKGKRGTMDYLLLEAALKKRPRLRTCLDQFCSCTKSVKKWKANDRAKMMLSSLVAASCEKNPFASVNIMWSQKDCPVPIESPCFSEIKDFLVKFTAI